MEAHMIGRVLDGSDGLAESEAAEARPPGTAVPDAFVRVTQQLHSWIERKLGYFGGDRFVIFYYDPRGQEVIWKDASSYGFASGGWIVFTEQIGPLAEHHRADVGLHSASTRGADVLLIDRLTREAYFAERALAEAFLKQQRLL
jgi:hypothetical protein